MNAVTLLKHSRCTTEINSCIFYIGIAFTFSPFVTENELLCSILHSSHGAPKVQHVPHNAHTSNFEAFVAPNH